MPTIPAPATKLAANLPVPTGGTSSPSKAGCSNTVTTNATTPAFQTSQSGSVAQQLNRLQAAIGGIASFGGAGNGVTDGLALSTTSGLTLNIAAGHAMIGGIIEYAGGSAVLPDSTANVYIWLKVDGTLEARTATTPPATAAAFLGSCTTSAGAISAIDYSGVLYLAGGIGVRYTSDTGTPGGTPNAYPAFLTKCPGGTFLWDGEDYLEVPDPARLNRLDKVVTLTPGATVATDASLGRHFRLTADQSFTLQNPTNMVDGQRMTWEIIQDGTGSRTLSFGSKFAFGTDITGVTLTTAANKRDFITGVYNSATDKVYIVDVVKGY